MIKVTFFIYRKSIPRIIRWYRQVTPFKTKVVGKIQQKERKKEKKNIAFEIKIYTLKTFLNNFL